MVGIREAVYRLMGEHYDFGVWWPNWFYEYRKDFVAYWLIMAGLLAFHFYGLWMDAREQAGAAEDAAPEGAPWSGWWCASSTVSSSSTSRT